MSPNCQMVNIFTPFQRRINCRAARGLRRTDQCGRGSWPWLSPLRLTPLPAGETVRSGVGGGKGVWDGRGGESKGVLQQLLTQSFAYWATWASTIWGFKLERRWWWSGRVEGQENWKLNGCEEDCSEGWRTEQTPPPPPRPSFSSPSTTFPSSSSPFSLPPPSQPLSSSFTYLQKM